MKIVFVVAAAAAAIVASAEPAEAKCGCGADLVTAAVVEGTPSIVIETACAAKQPALEMIDSAGKSVAVKLLSTHEGYSRSTQYMFEPERAIAAGSYKVKLRSAHGTSEHVLRVVAAPSKAVLPTWGTGPKVVEQNEEEYGCGPAKTVRVAVGTASHAVVELVDTKTLLRSSGYVRVENGSLSIGHGMCSGEFELVRGHAYTATIALLSVEQGTSTASKTVSFTYAP